MKPEERQKGAQGPLGPYRVLDLTDEKAMLCGRMLGDLGADVVKIEPPSGNRERWLEPFYQDTPGPDRSLFWLYYNANKLGITLDINRPEGRDLLRRLVAKADFLIESFPPGYLASLELGYEQLRAINPRLIVTSVTPFGQQGPYRDFKGTDMTLWAMGGRMYLDGNPDRPPVRVPCYQAYDQASAQAVAGSLVAHHARARTGLGQHVDVSIQESVLCTLQAAALSWDMLKQNDVRGATALAFKGAGGGAKQPPQVWRCNDGYVIWVFWSGSAGAALASTRRVVEMMVEAGMGTEVADVDWGQVNYRELSDEQPARYEAAFASFFKTKTMEELLAEGVAGRITIAPMLTIDQVVENPHTKARAVLVDVPHETLGADLRMFGPWLKLSDAELSIRRRAPRLGEHNDEVFVGELGLTADDLRCLAERSIV